MFPVRIKEHQRTFRNEEKFLVHPANTERLKNLQIPYMQKLLNRYVCKYFCFYDKFLNN